jgi:hypothetical protein
LATLINCGAGAFATSVAVGGLGTGITLNAEAVPISLVSAQIIQVNWNGPTNLVRAPGPGVNLWAGPLPYGHFYQAVGSRMLYGIDWDDWLAIRWAASQSVALGQVVRPLRDDGYQLSCVLAGITDTVEPDIAPYVGDYVNDGSAQWQVEWADNTSLAAMVEDAYWSCASSGVLIAASTIIGQVTMVLVDTTNAQPNQSYNVLCTVDTTDAQRPIGTIRIDVR